MHNHVLKPSSVVSESAQLSAEPAAQVALESTAEKIELLGQAFEVVFHKLDLLTDEVRSLKPVAIEAIKPE